MIQGPERKESGTRTRRNHSLGAFWISWISCVGEKEGANRGGSWASSCHGISLVFHSVHELLLLLPKDQLSSLLFGPSRLKKRDQDFLKIDLSPSIFSAFVSGQWRWRQYQGKKSQGMSHDWTTTHVSQPGKASFLLMHAGIVQTSSCVCTCVRVYVDVYVYVNLYVYVTVTVTVTVTGNLF